MLILDEAAPWGSQYVSILPDAPPDPAPSATVLTSLAGGSAPMSSRGFLLFSPSACATNGEKNRSRFESARATATRVAENATLEIGPAPAYAHA